MEILRISNFIKEKNKKWKQVIRCVCLALCKVEKIITPVNTAVTST